MDEREPLVTVRNLTLRYEGERQAEATLALDDINMTVDEGDFVCVLGPSGCGKSTLLNIIAGLLEPSAGEVLINGERASGVDYRRAVIFQSPVLYPWMNTYDNVAFGPRLRGVDRAETDERVRRYLELVGLSEFAESKPYELSGGMRQRAALARELVNDPYLILMDEPFGALDALTRINMQGLVRDIWSEAGKTLLMITHDVDEALLLGTKVYVMSARPGRIVERFDTGFTYQVEEGNDDIQYGEDYLHLKKGILELINGA